MTFGELMLRVFDQVRPLLPYMIAVIAATAAVLPVLLWLARGVWVSDERFRWMGMFFGMKKPDCVRLACAWIKLVLLISLLAAFKPMEIAHYLLFIIPGVVYALSTRELIRIPGRLIWVGLELVALLCCNLICGYIHDVDAGTGFTVVYVLMSILAALFGIYLFLTELNDISAGRSTDIENEWQAGSDAGEQN